MSELILLSIIQGVTEFLPISSSGHLILASEFFLMEKSNLTLDISLHIGSLLAVTFFFTKDIKNFLSEKSIFIKIIISSIPVSIIGVILLKFNLINYLRNYEIIGWSSIIFGIFLYISDKQKYKNNHTIKKNFNFKSAVIIGIFQIFSLIPGASRSGITITGARFLNFNKIESAKLSFLTAIPILIYATGYNILNLVNQNEVRVSILNLIAIFLSFIFSYVTINFFLKFLQSFNLTIFVVYRIILGSTILLYVYI